MMRPVLGALVLAGLTVASAATPKMPTFFARRDYTGLYSSWVQVADVNRDGILDVIGSLSGYIEVLLGNGNGTFSAGPSTSSGLTAGVFVATDLTGNGVVDLVLSGEVQQGPNLQYGIGVCTGNGDGTFQPATFYPAGSDTYEDLGSVVIGDFNNDGLPDAIAVGASGVWLFTGRRGGTFNPGAVVVPLPTASASAEAVDFNGDGKLDLVVTLPFAGLKGGGAGFVVLLGNGNGTFQPPTYFSTPKKPQTVAVGTLVEGGYPSIVLSSSTSSEVYVYIGNGAGGFSAPASFSLPVATGIAIGDVNGDGIPDLVSTGGYIALGRGNGTFKKPIYYPVQSGFPGPVVLADLRKKGRTDIVTDSHEAISVLLNVGKGKFEDGNWTGVTGGAACGAAADYNGDGKPDLAVNTASGMTILLGTGKAASPFTTGSTVTLSGSAGCPVTGDLNGDGIPDLVVGVSGNPNAVLANLGNGDGTFRLASSTPTPNSGGYIVLADFNQDGKLDFATSGNLLALGNGDGTFQTPAAFVPNPPLSGFSNITAGDINNDGWPDLVLTNLNVPYSNLFVLLNDQKGGFTQVPASFGALTLQAVLADLNGDGNLDVVLSYESGGGAWVYLGDGTGAFTQQAVLVDPLGLPGNVIVADVNGDGIPDIGVLESDTLSIYLGLGGATFGVPFSVGTGPAPGSILVENLHGQSASAGIPDIVAPDLSGDVTVLINKTR